MEKKEEYTRIIIAADDFGISEEANQKILALLALKKIDRVAVMVDGLRLPSPSEVRSLLDSGVALDLHLNGFQPIKADRQLSEPAFPRIIQFGVRLISRQISARKMEEKWRKEVGFFREIFGKIPDGLGAHQHIHFYPSYFKVVAKLAQEVGISYVRFGSHGLAGSSRSPIFWILRMLHGRDQKYFDASGLESTDYWFSLDWINDLELFRKKLPPGVTELVCHPERESEYQLIKENF